MNGKLAVNKTVYVTTTRGLLVKYYFNGSDSENKILQIRGFAF